MSEINVTPPSSPAIEEDRTVAILSYITIVGFIVAIVMHNGKKTSLGAFHLRQVLGLFIAGLVVWMACMILAVIPFIGVLSALLFPVVGLALFVLWIMGLIAAASGQKKPLPLVGDQFQTWFANAFV